VGPRVAAGIASASVDHVVDVAPARVTGREGRALSPLDLRMRKLLFLPVDATASATSARKVFEVSIWISATRCLLTYVILPFIFPIIGISANDHAIGLPISVVAVIADFMSIRRFWRADHKYRWHYTAIAGTIICCMLVLITGDLVNLL
jgi:hypothetical protein